MGSTGGAEITVLNNSCIGYQACQWFGIDSSDQIYIGDGACVGTEDDGIYYNNDGKSCYNFGRVDSDGNDPDSVILASGACVGDSTKDSTEICQECYAGVSATGVYIQSGDCSNAMPLS